MESPLVSVIYPVYNDLPTFVHQSIGSLKNQDYNNLEIIIIDDSSSIETISALNEYVADPRVKILRGNRTSGLPDALNIGLSIAKGKYIARADADDVQMFNRISTQVKFMETNESVGILGCNVKYIDLEGNPIKTRIYPENNESIRRQLHLRNPLCHSVVMLRRTVLDQVGVYNTTFKRAEDYELWLRASANDIRIHNLQEVLMEYRMATGAKRDILNWQMNLQLKKKYFSTHYLFESLLGIVSVYLYVLTPISIQNFIYKKLA